MMFSVIWPKGCMVVEEPAITYGSTQFDNPTMLARDVHNNMLVNNLSAIPSPKTLTVQKYINCKDESSNTGRDK
jgi:hypothetical protein